MPARRPSPTPAPRATDARRRLVAAARRHFLAHGFRGVTMADLASELGMSKKTLYAHFPSKTALVEAVFHDKLGALESEVEQIAAASEDDFRVALQQLLAAIQRHAEEVRPPFLRDLERESPESFQIVERRRRELIERCFTRLFNHGRKAGCIRKDTPPPVIIDVLLAATSAIVNPPRLAELGLTPKAAFAAIVSVILEGVLTAKGRTQP